MIKTLQKQNAAYKKIRILKKTFGANFSINKVNYQLHKNICTGLPGAAAQCKTALLPLHTCTAILRQSASFRPNFPFQLIMSFPAFTSLHLPPRIYLPLFALIFLLLKMTKTDILSKSNKKIIFGLKKIQTLQEKLI